MKKNRRFYFYTLLIAAVLCFGAPARAQLVFGASFDFLGDAAAAITPVFEQIQTAADEAVKFAKEKVTKLKAKIGSYFTKRKNAAEKVPGTKGFAEDSSVDIYDPAAVQAAVTELFLQYPSDDERINSLYEKEGVEFYYDTMIEVQTAARMLESQLNNLRKEVDEFSMNAIEPSGSAEGAADSSDENGNYYNLYLAHKKFNDVLKITEEVMALYSQYYVARAIYRRSILPAPYVEEGEEDGDGVLTTSSAEKVFHSDMAFAQLMTTASTAAAAKGLTAAKAAPAATASTAAKGLTAAKAAPAATASTAAKGLTAAKAAPAATASTAAKGLTAAKAAPAATASTAAKGLTAAKAAPAATASTAAKGLTAAKAGGAKTAAELSATSVTPAQAAKGLTAAKVGGVQVITAARETEEPTTAQTVQKQTAGKFSAVQAAVAPASVAKVSTINAEAAEAEEKTETEATTVLGGKVAFTVPAAPEPKTLMSGTEREREDLASISEGQKIMNRALEVHNTINLLPKYRNLFLQYEAFKELHAKAASAVAASDRCVIQYLRRRYDEPEKVWYGSSNAPQDPTAYDERTGLSGWAVAAFQVANADKSAGLDTDSFAMVDYGADVDSSDLNNLEVLSAKVATTDESKALSSPSQEEEISDAAREVELVAWQIGAQAAKILAEDQYSAEPKYGRAARPYPLWQDQKSFYNQYIDGKYENMKNYIRNLDLTNVSWQIANILNNYREEGETRDASARALGRLASYLGQSGGKNGVTAALQAKETALAKVDREEESALSSYMSRREKLQAQLDEVSTVINGLADEISLADSEVASGNAKVASSKSNIKVMNQRGTGSESSLYAMSQSDYSAGNRQIAENKAKGTSLRATSAEQEKKRNQLVAQIEALDNQINSVRQEYINRKSIVEAEQTTKLQKAATSSPVPTLMALVSRLGLYGSGVNSIVSRSDGMVANAKDYAIRLIDNARRDIYALGDGLYDPKNSKAVVKRHKELINSLKKLPKEQFLHSSYLSVLDGGASVIASLLSGAFTSAITGNICGKVSCNAADSRYFVGAVAQEKDFAAPKTPDFEHYPSPRDIVHFDATDYKSINKAAGGVVTKDSFLGYGGEIPGIWRQILAEDAFVEKGVDLTALLEQGGEDKFFMRGALYPCVLKNHIIDVSTSKVDVNQTSGMYLVTSGYNDRLPECNDISLHGAIYYTVRDLDLDKSVAAGTQRGLPNVSPSELGTLLFYGNQKLRFNSTSYNVYERMLELEEKAEKDEKFDYEVRDNVYQKAMYVNNQIGNFLHFVDKENSIRKNLDEMKLSIDDARASISEMLSEMGFDVAPDFNLANDEEYKYIRNKLLEYKNNLVGSAASKISGVNKSNDVVKERYDKVNNTRAALVQDNNALISVNVSTQAGSSLSETLRGEEANQKVMDRTQDEGLKAIRDEIDNYETPICVAY